MNEEGNGKFICDKPSFHCCSQFWGVCSTLAVCLQYLSNGCVLLRLCLVLGPGCKMEEAIGFLKSPMVPMVTSHGQELSSSPWDRWCQRIKAEHQPSFSPPHEGYTDCIPLIPPLLSHFHFLSALCSFSSFHFSSASHFYFLSTTCTFISFSVLLPASISLLCFCLSLTSPVDLMSIWFGKCTEGRLDYCSLVFWPLLFPRFFSQK